MSFNAGELTAYIDLDDSKFDRKLDRDRDELGRFTGKKHQATLDIDTTRAQTKLGALNGLIMDNSQQLQSAGMKMTAGVTLPYVLGTALMVESASSLNEAQNKVNVVFGESSDAVMQWGENAAETMGQSERQALSAAGTFGNLFVSMGMANDESAEMSMTLTSLASDLASFNDIDPAEALDALRSGLVGETEPMRRLGVNMNEATLKAQALAMGLQWTGETLPPLIKAQAAYALIMEQTTTAQGDYARTQDEVANSMRGVAAEAEDMAASFGEELLPVVKDVLGVAKPVLGFFSELPGPVKQATIVLGGLFAVIGPSLWMIGGMAEGLKTLKSAWAAIRTAFTVADTTAIGANTRAVELNSAARVRNSTTPPVGSSGAVPGAIGTGTGGLGAGPATQGGGFLGGMSAGTAALSIGTATISTTYMVIEAAGAFKSWWDQETGGTKDAEVARAQSLGRTIGEWKAENPGQELPQYLKDALAQFNEDAKLGLEDLQKGPLGLYFKSDKNIAAADALNKAIEVYASGNEEAIRAHKESIAKSDEAAGAADKNALASDDNTAAVQGLTGAVADAAASVDSLATASLEQINAMMALPGGIAGALTDAQNAEALEKADAMLKKRYKGGIDWSQVADTPGGSVDLDALYKEMGWKPPKRAAKGADFVTNGPELLLVGDNPSGREHVKVTPSEAGGKGGGFNVNVLVQASFIDMPTQSQLDKLGDRLGDRTVEKVLDALAVS